MAVTGIVEICNMALRRLGAEKISDAQYTTPDSKRSNLVKDSYPLVIKRMLENHPWNFALVQAELSGGSSPTYGYTYAHSLPSDYIRLSRYEDDDVLDLKFEIIGNKFHTDEETLKLTYVGYTVETTEALFTPLFKRALALELAIEISYSLLQSAEQQEQIKAEAKEALRDARLVDAQSGSPHSFIVTSWTDDRAVPE